MHPDSGSMTSSILDIIKMKLFISFTSDESSVWRLCLTLLFIGLINLIMGVVTRSHTLEEFYSILDTSNIKSLFCRENKILINGKTCFINGLFSTRHENLFSTSFYAIWDYVGSRINATDDIHSIKECSEYSGLHDEQTDNNMFINTRNTAFVVKQHSPFKLDSDIWCRVSSKIDNNDRSNSKINSKIENIEIKIFSYTKSVAELKTFVSDITDNYKRALHNSREGKRYIYTYMGGGDDDRNSWKRWNECVFNTTTSFDNIFFTQKEELIRKIDFFTENKDWYTYQGNPYTLGIGLSGTPGTGKTSTIKSIAKKLNRHLIIIPLNKIHTIQEFTEAFYESRYNKANKVNDITFNNKIIVFEDIDCMSSIVLSRACSSTDMSRHLAQTNRDINNGGPNTNVNNVNDANDANNTQLIGSIIKACKDDDFTSLKDSFHSNKDDKLTLSFILNVIDGIRETPGRIIIITSNHYKKLDEALVRPGRIDICLQMMKADIGIIQQMFDHFYSYKKWVGNGEGKPDFYDTIAASKYSVTDIDKRLSQAEIVQCYSESPIEFIENIAEKSLKLVI